MKLIYKYFWDEFEPKIFKKICYNVVYESDYNIAEIFNSVFPEIGVALDNKLGKDDENLLIFLYPTNEKNNVISARRFVSY